MILSRINESHECMGKSLPYQCHLCHSSHSCLRPAHAFGEAIFRPDHTAKSYKKLRFGIFITAEYEVSPKAERRGRKSFMIASQRFQQRIRSLFNFFWSVEKHDANSANTGTIGLVKSVQSVPHSACSYPLYIIFPDNDFAYLMNIIFILQWHNLPNFSRD